MTPTQRPIAALLIASILLSAAIQNPIPVIVVTLVLFLTALFHLLWNDTIPGIFNLRRITFWEAFRLLLLAWILFGGFFVRWKG